MTTNHTSTTKRFTASWLREWNRESNRPQWQKLLCQLHHFAGLRIINAAYSLIDFFPGTTTIAAVNYPLYVPYMSLIILNVLKVQ